MSILYRNGVIHAGREPAGWPEPVSTAFLVDEGRIEWLGDEAGVQRLDPGAGTRVVDLHGALVTPAFVDAHVHCTATGLALTGLGLRSASSAADVLVAVGERTRAARGRPILGSGWDETSWPDRRIPSAGDLDRASFGGVVYLSRVDEHSALVSSALMAAVSGLGQLAGFDAGGWLRGPAHEAVRAVALAGIGADLRRDAQLAALRRAAELGIACVHEMAGPVISSADDLASLRTLAEEHPLPCVVGYWGELLGIETARELGALGAGGDLFCDGSLGSHTAALGEPYTDAPGERGTLRFETADLVEHVVRCTSAGLQAGFHAIGDAAVDQVLTAIETATQRLGPAVRDAGHRLEHAEYVHDAARFAGSGLVASVQPCFDALWGGSDGMYAERLGTDRALRLNRFGDLAAAGVPLAFGSDSPVTPLGPWAAVRAATTPRSGAGSLSPGHAFAAHTRGGADAARGRGPVTDERLRRGAPATFAIWRCAAIEATLPRFGVDDAVPECLATVSRGVVLHDAGLLGG